VKSDDLIPEERTKEVRQWTEGVVKHLEELGAYIDGRITEEEFLKDKSESFIRGWRAPDGNRNSSTKN